VAGLLELGALVADLRAGGHELGVEVADLLLLDFVDFDVAETTLSLQFVDGSLGFRDTRLKIVDAPLEPDSHMAERFLPRLLLSGQIIVGNGGRQALRLIRIPGPRRSVYDVGILPDIQSLDQLVGGLVQPFGLLLRGAHGLLGIVIGLAEARKTKPVGQIRDAEPLRQIGESEPLRQIRQSKPFRGGSEPARHGADMKLWGWNSGS